MISLYAYIAHVERVLDHEQSRMLLLLLDRAFCQEQLHHDPATNCHLRLNGRKRSRSIIPKSHP